MASLEKLPRHRCETDKVGIETVCAREARFTLTVRTGSAKSHQWHVCYRHRHRALEIACEVERRFQAESKVRTI